ncbi:chromosome partition ATPase protein [Mycobacterium marinum M]|uniref:Nuclease SbcCD subunit C n=1 Tax=Mycobacterium marinum (strain ATCC BAA-535 / M) TaxID=216594 RepID=B2HL37_MYCMM|nr:SMC family ATPase [Mycobacterium marinum]ACC42013.1 chromosome partition ATPase protein [Mycobacterium marinum M]
MRPLRLRIKGLRSFRSEVEINFSELALVAIVGDTGAGKSSILEAITYALYNATTWEQRGVKQLISDGATTMTVQLDFACDGQRYRITRSTSRGQYPPPGHLLEYLSDPTIRPLDGEEAIKREIFRLVGLDWKGFTSAVILPQGSFQTLLQAPPADRTEILKGIFRLHELGLVREQAQTLAGEYRGSLEKLQADRVQLLPDPKAAANEAAGRKRKAEKFANKLREFRTQVTEQQKAANMQTEAAARLRDTATLVEQANTHPAAALQALRPVLEELDKRAVGLDRDERKLQRSDERASAAIERAEAAGESEATLARAQTVLSRLLSDLPELAAEKTRLEEERQALELEAKQLVSDEESLQLLRAAALEKERALKTIEKEVLAASNALQKASERLEEYRRLALEERTAAKTLAALEVEQQGAEKNLAKARAAEHQARSEAETAAAALAHIQRKHAAAHAAQGLGPGDGCPICGQTIPAGFKPPRAQRERAASKTNEDARRVQTEARDVRVKLEERCRQLGESIDQARTTSQTASRATKNAFRGLRAALGDADADPDVSKAALLEELTTRLHKQEAAAAKARGKAEAARLAFERRAAALQPRRDALSTRRQALERSNVKHSKQAEALAADRLTLPERFRPAANASVDRMGSVAERLRKRLDEVSGIRLERERIQRRFAELRSERNALAERRQEDFESPRRRLEQAALMLHSRLSDAAEIAHTEAPSFPESDIDFGAFVEAVAALEASAARVLDGLHGRASDADQAAERARQTIGTLLAKADAPTIDALDEQLIAARATFTRAKDDEVYAREQIPKVVALEEKLGPLREAIGTLDTLASMLTDGRFIGFVVARRQRALLGVASEIFGSMTGMRYGFAEDFRIIDRISGQPRGARTLSGGETFLASLSLALGLVELAARSGGRLEALFLDEGFGSLDADALQEALGELERRAATGRLVAVISHIRAVAESIESVLRVNYRPEGSEILLMTGTEREEFVSEEIEHGLLA